VTAHWPYYTLRQGYLFGEDGRLAFIDQDRPFTSVADAEDWLASRDLRGNVRSVS
jgi:hypothetical protein